MLRITILEKPKHVTLLLEGRLGGPWVEEVRREWGTALAKHEGRPLIVDLCNVTFVEDEGKELLAEIHDQGGALLASDVMVKGIVEEVQQRKRPQMLEL